jgi:hypothetical protein
MICINCNCEKLVSDFINSENICYKCLYRIKLNKAMENRTEKTNFCRICGKKVLRKKDLKKRQRSVFCSGDCALKGHKDQIKNYWTRGVCGGGHMNSYREAGVDPLG